MQQRGRFQEAVWILVLLHTKGVSDHCFAQSHVLALTLTLILALTLTLALTSTLTLTLTLTRIKHTNKHGSPQFVPQAPTAISTPCLLAEESNLYEPGSSPRL
jgi:hypothetical protein